MILITTGTNGAPFDRLLRGANAIQEDSLVVQHGPSGVRPRGATCVDYVSFSQLVDFVQDARVIITHGGVGSILVALMNGKSPLVVPRLARYGEAVDDHQLELACRLRDVGLVTLVEDVAQLPELIKPRQGNGVAASAQPSALLIDELGRYLATVVLSATPG